MNVSFISKLQKIILVAFISTLNCKNYSNVVLTMIQTALLQFCRVFVLFSLEFVFCSAPQTYLG